MSGGFKSHFLYQIIEDIDMFNVEPNSQFYPEKLYEMSKILVV